MKMFTKKHAFDVIWVNKNSILLLLQEIQNPQFGTMKAGKPR